MKPEQVAGQTEIRTNQLIAEKQIQLQQQKLTIEATEQNLVILYKELNELYGLG
jgi:hypothetical protein